MRPIIPSCSSTNIQAAFLLTPEWPGARKMRHRVAVPRSAHGLCKRVGQQRLLTTATAPMTSGMRAWHPILLRNDPSLRPAAQRHAPERSAGHMAPVRQPKVGACSLVADLLARLWQWAPDYLAGAPAASGWKPLQQRRGRALRCPRRRKPPDRRRHLSS